MRVAVPIWGQWANTGRPSTQVIAGAGYTIGPNAQEWTPRMGFISCKLLNFLDSVSFKMLLTYKNLIWGLQWWPTN